MLCPVCNGFNVYQGACSSCGGELTDWGRSSDWTGPYAPYEPVFLNAVQSASSIQLEAVCCHVLYCAACDQSNEVFISQI